MGAEPAWLDFAIPRQVLSDGWQKQPVLYVYNYKWEEMAPPTSHQSGPDGELIPTKTAEEEHYGH